MKYKNLPKKEEKKLPIEAEKGGFTNYQQWITAQIGGFSCVKDFESAQKGGFENYVQWQVAMQEGFNDRHDFEEWQNTQKNGFINKEEWQRAKQGGFNNYEQWEQASEEGFDNKVAWEEWQDAKQTGFLDINMFYEAKKIGFYNYTDYIQAKKGGFTSYLIWKVAQRWNVATQEEWEQIKKLDLLAKEKYEVFKELREKLEELLEELKPNDEISISRIKKVIGSDYGIEGVENDTIIYKSLTRKEFENVLGKVINDIIANQTKYKYSRLKDTLMRIDQNNISMISTINQNNRIQNEFQCPNCHNVIIKTSTFCPDCGYKIPRCEICKMPMLQEEQQGSCPYCKNSFHLSHFKEMVKIRGFCPLCKQEIKEYEIIINYN